MLVAMPQALVTFGTCVGYFTCYGTIQISGDMQWRLPFIVQAIGGVLLAIACCLLPKSPRWLIARNERQAALNSMKLLDFGSDEIRQDIMELNESQSQFTWRGVMSIFAKKYRFRSSLAFFILGMVQLCGIDGVLYVSLKSHTFLFS